MLEELLVLVDPPPEPHRRPPSRADLRLWIIHPRNNSVEVIPQDWFNQADYDFGYQWVTRVARDPKTGRVVGEGIRLGAFVLDKTGRQIESWLIEDYSSDT